MQNKPIHTQFQTSTPQPPEALLAYLLTSAAGKSSTPKDTATQLMFEYDQLRKEILQNDTLTLQILTVILLLTSALMGFSFSQQIIDDQLKMIMFFVVELVAFLGLNQNTNRMRSTSIIASYIKTFIEPRLPYVKWETRLSQFRSRHVKESKMDLISDQGLVYILLIAVNAILGCYYFYTSYDQSLSQYGLVIIITVVALLTSLYCVRQWRQSKHIEAKSTALYDTVWRAIRSEEDVA